MDGERLQRIRDRRIRAMALRLPGMAPDQLPNFLRQCLDAHERDLLGLVWAECVDSGSVRTKPR